MARTSSILSEPEWKSGLGDLLKELADIQNMKPIQIAKHLDRFEGSRGQARTSDWTRYASGERIPSELQIPRLAEALHVPVTIMRVCTGYIDDIFECVYGLLLDNRAATEFAVSKTRVAFAFLFSLFPTDEMHTGNFCALWSFIMGRPVRMNLDPDQGFCSGQGWNATWLYPENPQVPDLSETTVDPSLVTVIHVGPTRAKRSDQPWIEYSISSQVQVDIASPNASRILASPRVKIPSSDALCEAQHILHAKSLPLFVRDKLATEIVHSWADKYDKQIAHEVRRDLFPHRQKTITNAAAAWIRDQQRERPEYEDFWL